MPQVTWILHEQILERLTRHRRSLADAIERAGHEARIVSWEVGQPVPTVDVGPEQPVVLFGGHPFVKALNHDGRFQPGHLGVNDRTSVTQYLSNLPNEWFLNRWGTFMTWQQVKNSLADLPSSLPWNQFTGKLFIRPNSGFKTFAGTVLDQNKNLDLDIKTIDEFSGVMADTLVFVNTAVKLQGEFRFVVADGKVITGSEYRWDGRLDIRIDYPPECFELAQKVAQHEWQVDIAYTVDVALTELGPKVIELNGFSCAGLYACNLDEIAKHVSAAALKEFLGEDQ